MIRSNFQGTQPLCLGYAGWQTHCLKAPGFEFAMLHVAVLQHGGHVRVRMLQCVRQRPARAGPGRNGIGRRTAGGGGGGGAGCRKAGVLVQSTPCTSANAFIPLLLTC
jgi:hypothetical protein